MQVIEVNAGFIGLFIACAALVFCILIGIFYAHETSKKIARMKKREESKISYLQEMEKIHIADAKKQAYQLGYETGYAKAQRESRKVG